MFDFYNHPVSPFAKRVRVLASELGLPIRKIEVDFAKGEHRTPDFLALNPNGRVPVIVKDGRPLWESAALLYELAAEKPEAGLVPDVLAERAEMLRWMFWSATHFEPLGRGIVFEVLIKPRLMKESPDMGRVEEYMRDLARHAEVLDRHLKGRTWILGARFSIADIALGTIVETAQRVRFSLEPYAEIARWFGGLAARESWAA